MIATFILANILFFGIHTIPSETDKSAETVPSSSQTLEMVRNEVREAADNEQVINVYIVTVNPNADLDQVMAAMKAGTGGKIVHVYRESLYGFAIEVPKGITRLNLLSFEGVVEVEQDIIIKPMLDEQSQADIQSNSSGLAGANVQYSTGGILRIGAHLSETANINGVDDKLNVNIAIIDTGIDSTHPDLNVVFSKSFISGISSGQDDHGHGTHVAGIAAARDNAMGVVGVAPGARLYALKVLNKTAWGYLSDIIAAVNWVTSASKPPTSSSSAQKNYDKYMKKYNSEMNKYNKYLAKAESYRLRALEYKALAEQYQSGQDSDSIRKYNSYMKKYESYMKKNASYLAKAERYKTKAEGYKAQADQYLALIGSGGKNPNKIDVVNMSIGAVGVNSALQKAIRACVEQGVVVVVSAGNDAKDIFGPDGKIYTSDDIIPAAYPEVVTVSAMADTDGAAGGHGVTALFNTPDDSMPAFSNNSSYAASNNPVISPGKGIDVAAPGVNILSSWLGGSHRSLSGTSMSAPHVAGAFGLLIAKLGQDVNKDGRTDSQDVTQLRTILIETSQPQSQWRANYRGDRDSYHEGLVQVSSF